MSENNKLQTTIPVIIINTGEPKQVQREFNPDNGFNFGNGSIKMNIQVQDMVGSRLFVEFKANGTFQMTQQVGMYQVPVTGNWNYNPLTRQLALQGVVNTFQPFILSLTLTNRVKDTMVVAIGSDGIGYILELVL